MSWLKENKRTILIVLGVIVIVGVIYVANVTAELTNVVTKMF